MNELPDWYPQGDDREFLYDVDLGDIRQCFLRYHASWLSLFEFGIDSCRFDLIRVNWWEQKIAGFEFKISKHDLLNDGKWQHYLKYCNTFSFAMPMAITKEAKEKLPSNIGIVGFYKWRFKDDLFRDFIVARAWLRMPRRKEISQEIYIKVISLLLGRAKFRSGDLF